MLSDDFLDRLRRRAADPGTSSCATEAARKASLLAGALPTVRAGLDGQFPAAPAPLPPPASAADVAAAEAALGFSLPDDLKRLYTAVADGGFGPGPGLASLKDAAARYLELRAGPPGEGGRAWPEALLPIGLSGPGAHCYDLKSGAIVVWNERSLEDGPPGAAWARSFRPEAKSLTAWLRAWLGEPPVADRQERDMEAAMLQSVRQSLAKLRDMPSEERMALGLPDEGWEEELFGHLGHGLKKP